MNKYKLLRFGRCYINRGGDFVIGLLGGDKKHGYQFAGSHANRAVWLGKIQVLSRIVPNDGNWIEIDPATFNIASACHVTGHVVNLPSKRGEIPVITKKY